MKNIRLFNKIPIKIPKDKKVLVIFDIDGVVCKYSHLPNIETSKYIPESIISISQKQCRITKEFYDTAKELESEGIDFEFLTYRSKKSEENTKAMFKNVGLERLAKKVTYSRQENDTFNQYTKRKGDIIAKKEQNQDRIYYVDDYLPFVEFINQKKGKTVAFHL